MHQQVFVEHPRHTQCWVRPRGFWDGGGEKSSGDDERGHRFWAWGQLCMSSEYLTFNFKELSSSTGAKVVRENRTT